MNAIGLIEITGLVAAIEALDAMLKAADVEFLTWEKRLGGRLVTVIVKGEVSAVQEAISTGKVRADEITRAVAWAVIPSPHPETMRMISISASKISNNRLGGINEF
ncbi:BMC domain-containing protein [Caldanaerobius polysaccharolyticus]|uniref:BMC domain-containing protein n=1 Tax=Caldanaerobius polysaccharolyticus TaxID=44256 RepID=UPI00047A07A8|nr:BMC domain-containing protein [Caldanaerobius polysaccharolyticus]